MTLFKSLTFQGLIFTCAAIFGSLVPLSAHSSFDFAKLIAEAAKVTQCEDLALGEENVAHTIGSRLAFVGESQFYKNITAQLFIETQPVSGYGQYDLVPNNSGIELYNARLLVELKDSGLSIYQDFARNRKWLPDLIGNIRWNRSFAQQIRSAAEFTTVVKESRSRIIMSEAGGYDNVIASMLAVANNRNTNFGIRWLDELIKKTNLDKATEKEVKGELLTQISFGEPISEIRFVSDKKLQLSDEFDSGYLSIIGWSRTIYLRIQHGQVREISQADFEKVVTEIHPYIQPADDIRPNILNTRFNTESNRWFFNFSNASYYTVNKENILKAAGVPYDPQRTDDFNYLKSVLQQFNTNTYRQARNLPRPSQEREPYLDLLLLDTLGRQEQDISSLRQALGKMTEGIMHFAKAVEKHSSPAGHGLVDISLNSFPSIFYRLGARALTENEELRLQLVKIFNDWAKNRNVSAQLSSIETSGSTIPRSQKEIKGVPLFNLQVTSKDLPARTYTIYGDNQVTLVGTPPAHHLMSAEPN